MLSADKFKTASISFLFLRIYTASAVAVYIHQQLQYIFNCRCSIYSFFGCTILYVLFRLLRVRGDEVLAAVDDADKLGVFPLVELVYLIVVLLGHYLAEETLHVREVGVAVFIQKLLGGDYLLEVRRPVMFLPDGGRWLHFGTDEPGQFFPDALDDGFRYFLYERAFFHQPRISSEMPEMRKVSR